MEEFVLSLDFLLSNCPTVLNNVYDLPVKYYFWRFGYTITRLWNLVQLSEIVHNGIIS